MSEQKEDDEINIDFSKIKRFFSKKKKPEVAEKPKEEVKQEQPISQGFKEDIAISDIKDISEAAKVSEKPKEPEQSQPKPISEPQIIETKPVESQKEAPVAENKEKDDDEISLDFSKIKKIFKSDDKPKESHSEAKKEDDEINIDFSKIKKIFKSDDKPKEVSTQSEEKDDEIKIDFSKVKNIFKQKDKTETKDDDELSIDWKKTAQFAKKYSAVILILIAIIFSVYLRVAPAHLPITDDWARDSVYNGLRNQISAQINQQAPNLPQNFKDVEINKQLDKVLKEQKSQIDQQIQATSDYFKSRMQDETGQTYLLAIDPWFWMRHARNVINNGHPGDEIRDGVQWDNHMFAPSGRPLPPDMFHAYFEGYLFKILSFFNQDLTLMRVVFYVPVLLSALSVIPAFFIARKLGGNFGGFVAAFFIAIHPAFLNRTAGGFADTDAYNILFPLMIAWLFLLALDSKKLHWGILFAALSGFLVGLFSFSWGGWWFIFDFIIGSSLIYLTYYAIIHRNDLKNILKRFEFKKSIISLIAFITASGIFVTLFRGFRVFYNEPFLAPIGFAKLKEVGIRTIWPNVFTTVAEQNASSLNSVISQIGLGKWVFLLIALIGIVLTLSRINEKKWWFLIGTVTYYVIIFIIRPQNLNLFLFLISIPIAIRLVIAILEKDSKIDIKYSILLIIWMIATIYASVKGVRFMLLLVPPFSIGFGIAIGQVFRYVNNLLTKSFDLNKYISNITVGVVLLLLLISPYQSAAETSKREIPSMNDAWYESLDSIRLDSEPDAIINSWWDFGHWFKYIGDRPVTFDGTSQNTPQAHWIGNSLLTSDEKTAVGILRMLDCSGFQSGTYAYFKAYEILEDEPEAISLLYEIIRLNRNEAVSVLEDKEFNEEHINELLSYTHCEPPQNYYITSDDMIGKSGVWAHFGSWNFDRALIYKTLKSDEYKKKLEPSVKFLMERFDMDRNEAENLYYEVEGITDSSQANNWIAPWPGYAGSVGCSRADNFTLQCGQFLINMTTRDALVPTAEGIKHPKSFSFMTNDDVILKEYEGDIITLQNGRGLGLGLIKRGESYELLQMDEALSGSMFTRLYYMDGIGLSHFKKFNEKNAVTGGRIVVWKVDWEGKEKNIIPEPEPVVVEEPVVEETPVESENTGIPTEEELDSEEIVEDTANENQSETQVN